MKTIYQILTQFQTDLASDIPALLITAGLPQLDNYVIGESRNAREKAICIYKDNLRMDDLQNSLSLIFQAQLYQTDFEVAAKYEDVFMQYFLKYKPSETGMNILDGLNSDTWPMENSSGVLIFFSVQYIEYKDVCDD